MGPPPPLLVETDHETVRRRLFMRRTAEKDVSPWVCYIPAFDPARLNRDIIYPEDI